MNIRLLAAAAVALFLTSCGGGGGSGGSGESGPSASMPAPLSSYTTAELEEFRALVGGEPLTITSEQIRDILLTRQGAADRFHSTDILSLSLSGRGRHVATCTGATCSAGGSIFSPADLDFSEGTYAPVMTRNGVSMAAGASRDGNQFSEGYGGWLEHNAFFVERDALVGADNIVQSADIYAISIGSESGSNPVSGSATWMGTMAGMDTVAVQILHGDTEITADFASSNLDVAFTRIYDEELQRRSDILWSDVPLVSGGFFSHGIGYGDKIEGTFYGPNHEEVGGVFEHGDIVGSFGAKRQ